MSESWKAKYLQECEAMEARERDWTAERHSLERMLVRTSVASAGQSPELDELMAKLRAQLRKSDGNSKSLGKLQSLIDEQLILLDEQKKQAGSRLQSGFRGLVSASRKHPLLSAQAKELKALEQALRGADMGVSALERWLAELIELLARALATSSGGTAPKVGLLTKLLGRDGPLPAPEPGEADGLSLVEDADQRLHIARRISELVGHMLTKVDLEPRAHARAGYLRDHLAQNHDWEALSHSLNELADLIIASINRGQHEFESFLLRLDERLALLQDSFSSQSDIMQGAQRAAKNFDQTLRGGLEELGTEVAASNDLQTLKVSVSAHIDTIIETMDQYRSDELHREQVLTEQVTVMKEKLAAVEARSDLIKEQLGEARARAVTDVLTQLPNREAWQERLSFEFARWQRYRYPVVVGVLDIDNFKRVNDTFGHKAGDRVLQKLAEAVQQRLRNTDFVARYGGEEFVVILPETPLEAAVTVLNQLREHISGLPFHFRSQPVSVTFSAGITEMAEGDDEASVFERADKAMYEAKEAGRNCIRQLTRN